MKIALINGPISGNASFMREGRCTQRASIWSTQWPPITLAYLAAVALKSGHKPRIFDCPAEVVPLSRLLKILNGVKPDLCVLAVSTPSIEDDMATAENIKEALPGARLALCGVHASALDLELLAENPCVDFIIRREPEETFSELIEALREDADVSRVNGLSFQAGGKPRRNPDRPFIKNLDRLPFPAWDAADLNLYRLPFQKQGQLCVAPLRGCRRRCSFCTAGAYYGRSVRFRGVDSVIEEIRTGRRKFGIHDFFMWADTFTIDKNFVMKLTEAMRLETPGIRWTANSRLDTVDEQMLQSMRAAGCWMISFGMESTDPAVLSQMGKNQRAVDYNAPVQMAKKAGIKTLGHFIFGLPGETPESMQKTLEDALAMDLDFAQFYTAAPFVGSSLFDEAAKRNYISKNDFARVSQSGASLDLPGLPPKRVDAMRRRAMIRFYWRPARIFRLAGLAGFGIFRQAARIILRRYKEYKSR